MGFTARTSAPSASNRYWIHTSAGGLNECIKVSGKSVLPNCTGYAWGRFYEISGKRPKLSKANAEMWFGNTSDGYARGKTPRVGAVVCWAKGKVGNSKDGAGHVAIVEAVYSDGSFLTSNSGYKSTRFYTKKIGKDCKLAGYTFQGFIYNPAVSGSSGGSSGSSGGSYKVGSTYTLKTAMKVRTGAGTGYAQKTVSQLTAGGKKAATSTKGSAGAVFKAGTRVTVQQVKTVGGAVWIKVPSGWICARIGTKIYVT